MTYATDEASVEDGNPVELYEFIGTITTYRYTSSDDDITFDGDVYTAITMKRDGISTPPGGNSPALVVTVPVTSSLAADYAFVAAAPPDLLLNVYRVHGPSFLLANSVTLWTGEVSAFEVKGNTVSMRIPSPYTQRLGDKIPAVHYQRECNNVLFDTYCSATRASYLVTTDVAISGISDDGKQITVTSMSPEATGWANGGDIVKISTGERRMVLDQTGDVLTIMWPFSSDLTDLDAVEVSAGCDHSIDECVSKFNNADNFTGMPFVVTQDIDFTSWHRLHSDKRK